jgi:ribonuclease HI
MTVRVYTDGASSPNGHGGWAAILFVDGVPIDGRYGGQKSITNNIMELQGLIEGMKLLPLVERLRCKDCGVVDSPCMIGCPEIKGKILRPVYEDAVIVSDSAYCVNGAKTWIHGWKQNGWKTKEKKPVKNQELWEEVDRLARLTGARFEWVKGHNGDAGNELADVWAGAGKMMMYQTGPGAKQGWLNIPGIGGI